MKNTRLENEITADWVGNIQEPVVSICCATYNHGPYIEEALQGFLMQKTDFPFEVLINDDASTDNTAEVIQQYEKDYPNIIKPIYQTENQYSKGNNRPNSTFNYPRSQAEYIALCEGDDYWTDSSKLQSQITQLINNPKICLSLHSAIRLDNETLKEEIMGNFQDTDGLISVGEIIERKSGLIPTASTVIRSALLPKISDFMEKNNTTVGDVYIHFFGAHESGGALYINKPMSVYRTNIPGSWNSSFSNNKNYQITHMVSLIKSYESLNYQTKMAYQKSFRYISYYPAKYILINCPSFKRRIHFLFSFIRLFSFKQQLYLAVWCLFHPILISAKK